MAFLINYWVIRKSWSIMRRLTTTYKAYNKRAIEKEFQELKNSLNMCKCEQCTVQCNVLHPNEPNENYSRSGGWYKGLSGSTIRWEITLELRIRTQSFTGWLKCISKPIFNLTAQSGKTPSSQTISPSCRHTCGFQAQTPFLTCWQE